MSMQPNKKQEQPSTYFVEDRSSKEEMYRLHLQDQMLTTSMGGALPEQSDLTIFQRVLDVGCGTGDWLIDVAKTYPDISFLIGVDISKKMIEYARTQAEAQQVNNRVEFHTMDVLRSLAFPEGYFDLVNQRFGVSYLRTWDWPTILSEYQRVTHPGGVIRVTEANYILSSSSPALTFLQGLTTEAFYNAGRIFTATSNGLISELERLLHQFGLLQVQTRMNVVDYRAGTVEGQDLIEVTKLFYRTSLPFLQKWTRIPANYETIYQQMVKEMQQPDFVVTWELLTAWGMVPSKDARQSVITPIA